MTDGQSFNELMQAAVNIKSYQLNQKKKKFELLPEFSKASVYYTKKLKNARQQRFNQKLIVHELIKSQGLKQLDASRAIHKWEEALSLWIYYKCSNPKWQEDGIDDDEIELVDDFGLNPEQADKIKSLKLNCYLNIAVCALKVKKFSEGIKACEESIKLDNKCVKAYYLRARCRVVDINSGVEDLNLAIEDFRAALVLNPDNKPIKNQLIQVQKTVALNKKREKDTYGKMFNKSSVSEYVETEIRPKI